MHPSYNCHQRKGKRTCPALSGMICAVCRGEHRLATIECPSGCVYLGGLSIVRDGPVGFSKSDYTAAVHGLMAHMGAEHDTSVSTIVDGRLQKMRDLEVEKDDSFLWVKRTGPDPTILGRHSFAR